MFNFKNTLMLLLVASLGVSFAGMAKLADPTKPAYMVKKNVSKKPMPVKKQKPLTVNSTLISDTRKLAVINNVLAAVGEKVDNARVIEIARNYVIVMRGGKKITLPFGATVRRETTIKKGE